MQNIELTTIPAITLHFHFYYRYANITPFFCFMAYCEKIQEIVNPDNLQPQDPDIGGGELTAEAAAICEDTKNNLRFLSFEAVKSHLAKHYKRGYEAVNGQKSPLRQIPRGWVRELVIEAFRQHPWSKMHKLALEVDGIHIPVTYGVFKEAGRLDELRQFHQEAIDEYLKDFDHVCEFVASRHFKGEWGGWMRIRKWWPEIIRRMFEQNPFTPLYKMKLTHGGQIISTPYSVTHEYPVQDRQEYLHELNAIYRQVFDKYIGESWGNACEYIFHPSFYKLGGWACVPGKYHKQFLEEAFKQNPFTATNKLALEYKGRKRKAPKDYYYTSGRYSELTKMARVVLIEYLTDLNKVVDFISHTNFSKFGGWQTVPEHWRRVLVVNAVLQMENRKFSTRKMRNYRYRGKPISLEGLYCFYKGKGQLNIFNNYVESAAEIGEQLTALSTASASPEKQTIPNTKHKWILPHDTSEAMHELVQRAQNDDTHARNLAVQQCGNLIRKIAYRLGRTEDERENLVSDGIEITYACIGRYDLQRGEAKFSTYLTAALEIELKHRRRAYASGKSYKTVRYEANRKILYPLAVSIEETIIGTDNKKIKDILTSEDGAETAPSAQAITANARDLVERIIETLPAREQIIAKQHYGILNGRRFSVHQLQEATSRPDIRQLLLSAVKTLATILRDLCGDGKSPVWKEKTKEQQRETLRTILLESQDPEETINGDNALGVLLYGELAGDLKDICNYAITELMDPEGAILLTEIFNVPRLKERSNVEIGTALKITRERVRQIIKDDIDPAIRRKLTEDFGLKPEDIFAE